MKIEELKKIAGEALSAFTTLNHFEGFSKKQMDVILPFYDSAVQRIFTGVSKKRFRADGEPRGFPEPYRYSEDTRAATFFKEEVKNPEPKIDAYRMIAAAIVVSLSDRSLYPADKFAVEKMCAILGYSIEEMNKFVYEEDEQIIYSLAGCNMRPIAVILFRALLDCMYEDCGLDDYIRYDEEYRAVWKKHVEQERQNAIEKRMDQEEISDEELERLYAEAEENAEKHADKLVKPAQSKPIKPKIHPKRDRFVKLVEYLLDEKLLEFSFGDSEPFEGGEWLNPRSASDEIAADLQRPYQNFILRRVQYDALHSATGAEAKILQAQLDRFFWQLENWINEELKKLDKQMLCETAKPYASVKATGKVNISKGSASGNKVIPFANNLLNHSAMESLSRASLTNPLSTPLGKNIYGIPSKYTSKPNSDLFPGRTTKTAIDALAEEAEFREETIPKYCGKVMFHGQRLLDERTKVESELLKHDDAPMILESAFAAILLDDEAYMTASGMFGLLVLARHSGLPNAGYHIPQLDDEDDWNEGVDIGQNPKLESTILSNDDWLETKLKIGITELCRNVAVLSQLAERRVRAPITIRKSHVALFKKLGLSDRKARDYAVVLGTFRAMNQDMWDEEEEIFHQATFDANVIENTDRETELRQMTDEALHGKRIAEREAQRLRHELAVLKRENEARIAELDEQIKKRNDLLELYEARDDEDALGTDAVDADANVFPYYTDQKVVLYGGFESFRRDMERLLPGIRIIPHAAHIDISPLRSADIVFIQINHTSHSNYWTVTDVAKSNNIPFYHLNYAGAKRCAVEMVEKLKELKDKLE